MKTYTKEIIILLLGLLGAYPSIKSQTVAPTKHSVKITFHQKNITNNYESDINIYAIKLKKWADSTIANPNSKIELPELPPTLENARIDINTEKINDSVFMDISIHQRRSNKRVHFEKLQMDTIAPERGKGFQPRTGKLRNRHKIKNVVTYSHFDLGFLTVNARPPISNGTFPPPITDFHQMPELDNFRTLQIGFEKDWGYNIIKGKLRFWFGINYNIQNYRFRDNQVRLLPHAQEFTYEIAPTTNKQDIADKSKIVTNYLGIPISLGYQNKPKNPSFSVKLGIQGGYLVRCHSKIRTLDGEKIKHFDDFNMNDFAIHPFASIKLKSIEFYAKYGITNMFKKFQGTPSRNMAFGIILATTID